MEMPFGLVWVDWMTALAFWDESPCDLLEVPSCMCGASIAVLDDSETAETLPLDKMEQPASDPLVSWEANVTISCPCDSLEEGSVVSTVRKNEIVIKILCIKKKVPRAQQLEQT